MAVAWSDAAALQNPKDTETENRAHKRSGRLKLPVLDS